MTPNIEKVFKIFKKYYKEIPLEIYKKPYFVLISTLLSARTRDEVTLKICQRLFLKAPNIKKLNSLSQKEITDLIHGVGFYKAKTKYLKGLSKMVLETFKGKIPETRDELIKLPGVGRKTANLVLNRSFEIPAIAVDTHVHRISNLLGFVKTKTPEKTELVLNKIIPKKYWWQMNKLFVSIGRQYRSSNELKKFLRRENLI